MYFKVKQTVRRGAETDKGYRREWFGDLFVRYLPASQSVTASQTSVSAAIGGLRTVTVASGVTDEICENPSDSAGCDGVTDREPGSLDEVMIWTR